MRETERMEEGDIYAGQTISLSASMYSLAYVYIYGKRARGAVAKFLLAERGKRGAGE